MSVFSLDHLSAELHIGVALLRGGSTNVTLSKPSQLLTASIHIELSGPTLEAVITIGNTTNSITLQADDTANAQHLADFIEAIANGTAGTAEEPPVRLHQVVTDNPQAFNAAPAAAMKPDMVNHPAHYTGHPSGVECIEVAEHLPFCLGNAFKYLFRRNDKGTLRQNLEKALWYIRRELDYRAASSAAYMLSDEAMGPLAEIIDHEPAPYSHIMELVGRGIMLDLADRMLIDVIAGLPD